MLLRQRSSSEGPAAQLFDGLIILAGDKHLRHAIDDAAGNRKIQPALACLHIRFGAARADLQGARRQGLQSHGHTAKQNQLDIKSLLFKKSSFGADPEGTVAQGLARRAKKDLGPLLGW